MERRPWILSLHRQTLEAGVWAGVLASMPVGLLGLAWLPERMRIVEPAWVVPMRVSSLLLVMLVPALVGVWLGRRGGSPAQGAAGGALAGVMLANWGLTFAFACHATEPAIARAIVGEGPESLVPILADMLAASAIGATLTSMICTAAGAAAGALGASVARRDEAAQPETVEESAALWGLAWGALPAPLLWFALVTATTYLWSSLVENTHAPNMEHLDVRPAQAGILLVQGWLALCSLGAFWQIAHLARRRSAETSRARLWFNLAAGIAAVSVVASADSALRPVLLTGVLGLAVAGNGGWSMGESAQRGAETAGALQWIREAAAWMLPVLTVPSSVTTMWGLAIALIGVDSIVALTAGRPLAEGEVAPPEWQLLERLLWQTPASAATALAVAAVLQLGRARWLARTHTST
jgi:hypothetical protein